MTTSSPPPDDHGHAPDRGHGDDGHSHDGHEHSHTTLDRDLLTRRRGLRAIWISAAGLAATAAVQFGIVAISSSAGLFADALHNLGDVAGTGALYLGFRLAMRPASDRFPHGWRRFEDLAGLVIVLAIAVSGALALFDSLDALLGGGHTVTNAAWAFGAALVGAVGNEAVAIYKIRVGRSIRSAALIADGRHARVDGLVSLGAAVGIAGAAAGYPVADPLAGLVIVAVIAGILVRTAREVIPRIVDAVDPELVAELETVARQVPDVEGVHDVRPRHVGGGLLVQLHVEIDGDLSLREAHHVSERVSHHLAHEFPNVLTVDIHIDPAGEHDDAHADTAHHFASGIHGGPEGR